MKMVTSHLSASCQHPYQSSFIFKARSRPGDETESEAGSRPATALRVNLPASASVARTTPTPALSRGSATPRSAFSWETFNGTEEVTHASHTAAARLNSDAARPGSAAAAAAAQKPPSSQPILGRNSSGESGDRLEDSLSTLPDSLNGGFDGSGIGGSGGGVREEFHSPVLYPDSLGRIPTNNSSSSTTTNINNNNLKKSSSTSTSRFVDGLGVPEDIDSLQLMEEDAGFAAAANHLSPPDSLNAADVYPPAPPQPAAAELFFDSITLLDTTETKPLPPLVGSGGGQDSAAAGKRRIIPFCDNSLSSGTSAFTSQDASFESKESSPPNNKMQQVEIT